MVRGPHPQCLRFAKALDPPRQRAGGLTRCSAVPAHAESLYAIALRVRGGRHAPAGAGPPRDKSQLCSPLSSLLPPSCLSLANTALTSSSSEGFSFAAGASGCPAAVVTSAGSSVEPCTSLATGFSFAARWTSRSRSICEHSPSVTGSMGVRLGAFQWVRSRIAWIVDLVVPTRRITWL